MSVAVVEDKKRDLLTRINTNYRLREEHDVRDVKPSLLPVPQRKLLDIQQQAARNNAAASRRVSSPKTQQQQSPKITVATVATSSLPVVAKGNLREFFSESRRQQQHQNQSSPKGAHQSIPRHGHGQTVNSNHDDGRSVSKHSAAQQQPSGFPFRPTLARPRPNSGGMMNRLAPTVPGMVASSSSASTVAATVASKKVPTATTTTVTFASNVRNQSLIPPKKITTATTTTTTTSTSRHAQAADRYYNDTEEDEEEEYEDDQERVEQDEYDDEDDDEAVEVEEDEMEDNGDDDDEVYEVEAKKSHGSQQRSEQKTMTSQSNQVKKSILTSQNRRYPESHQDDHVENKQQQRQYPTNNHQGGKALNAIPRGPATTKSNSVVAESEEIDPSNLVECGICNRKFLPERIEKHEQACELAHKKRKTFDPAKMRISGTDIERFERENGGNQKRRQKEAPIAVKKSSWREKHESFLSSIRAAKEMKAHLAAGGRPQDLPPPPPSENPDYVACPTCGRRFNEKAADRHIISCSERSKRNKPAPKVGAQLRNLKIK